MVTRGIHKRAVVDVVWFVSVRGIGPPTMALVVRHRTITNRMIGYLLALLPERLVHSPGIGPGPVIGIAVRDSWPHLHRLPVRMYCPGHAAAQALQGLAYYSDQVVPCIHGVLLQFPKFILGHFLGAVRTRKRIFIIPNSVFHGGKAV